MLVNRNAAGFSDRRSHAGVSRRGRRPAATRVALAVGGLSALMGSWTGLRMASAHQEIFAAGESAYVTLFPSTKSSAAAATLEITVASILGPVAASQEIRAADANQNGTLEAEEAAALRGRLGQRAAALFRFTLDERPIVPGFRPISAPSGITDGMSSGLTLAPTPVVTELHTELVLPNAPHRVSVELADRDSRNSQLMAAEVDVEAGGGWRLDGIPDQAPRNATSAGPAGGQRGRAVNFAIPVGTDLAPSGALVFRISPTGSGGGHPDRSQHEPGEARNAGSPRFASSSIRSTARLVAAAAVVVCIVALAIVERLRRTRRSSRPPAANRQDGED